MRALSRVLAVLACVFYPLKRKIDLCWEEERERVLSRAIPVILVLVVTALYLDQSMWTADMLAT